MGSECRDLTSTPPKLSLFSLPSNKAVESPGILTPPIKTLASVPFQWEEAPGKPRPCCLGGGDTKPVKSVVVKCLELPPRLLTEAKFSGMTSPTMVLASRSLGNALSFRKGPEEKGRVLFGSSRWRSFKMNNQEIDFLFSDVKGDTGDDDGTKVKITRIKKRSVSFRSNISPIKSHYFLTSIYERFKQVVPSSWSRRRQEKLRKKVSC